LPAFSKSKNETYEKISDLDDKLINELMDFIEKEPPSNI
jgi:hypothetical protein